MARLQISNVSRSDAGHYRCRVDYRNAPTRNFKYHLIVVGKLIAAIIILPFFFAIPTLPISFNLKFDIIELLFLVWFLLNYIIILSFFYF